MIENNYDVVIGLYLGIILFFLGIGRWEVIGKVT